jgi:hypothetical protein
LPLFTYSSTIGSSLAFQDASREIISGERRPRAIKWVMPALKIEIHAAYQTDFLIHISVFHFPSLHLSFIIAAARGGRAMVYDKRKMENGK